MLPRRQSILLSFFAVLALASLTGAAPVPQPVATDSKAQEVWKNMTRQERDALVRQWEALDETTRPAFPVFRDQLLDPRENTAFPENNAADNSPAAPATQSSPQSGK